MSNDPQQTPTLQKIRVVLVDGHALFGDGLGKLLEQDAIDIVGHASDGGRAVAVVRDTVPDVVLMDVATAGISGIEATKRIRALAPRTQVIMLTLSADERDVEEAIWAGACGYLLKDAPVEQVLAAIQGAAAGESHLSPRIAAGILNRMRADPDNGALPGEGWAELTKREKEVLRLMAHGKENAQIAKELFISVQTVKHHVSNILLKLEVENRVQAAVQAFRSRLLE